MCVFFFVFVAVPLIYFLLCPLSGCFRARERALQPCPICLSSHETGPVRFTHQYIYRIPPSVCPVCNREYFLYTSLVITTALLEAFLSANRFDGLPDGTIFTARNYSRCAGIAALW